MRRRGQSMIHNLFILFPCTTLLFHHQCVWEIYFEKSIATTKMSLTTILRYSFNNNHFWTIFYGEINIRRNTDRKNLPRARFLHCTTPTSPSPVDISQSDSKLHRHIHSIPIIRNWNKYKIYYSLCYICYRNGVRRKSCRRIWSENKYRCLTEFGLSLHS